GGSRITTLAPPGPALGSAAGAALHGRALRRVRRDRRAEERARAAPVAIPSRRRFVVGHSARGTQVAFLPRRGRAAARRAFRAAGGQARADAAAGHRAAAGGEHRAAGGAEPVVPVGVALGDLAGVPAHGAGVWRGGGGGVAAGRGGRVLGGVPVAQGGGVPAGGDVVPAHHRPGAAQRRLEVVRAGVLRLGQPPHPARRLPRRPREADGGAAGRAAPRVVEHQAAGAARPVLHRHPQRQHRGGDVVRAQGVPRVRPAAPARGGAGARHRLLLDAAGLLRARAQGVSRGGRVRHRPAAPAPGRVQRGARRGRGGRPLHLQRGVGGCVAADRLQQRHGEGGGGAGEPVARRRRHRRPRPGHHRGGAGAHGGAAAAGGGAAPGRGEAAQLAAPRRARGAARAARRCRAGGGGGCAFQRAGGGAEHADGGGV
ncbi:MAG: hypothetical protein AVDCRST_MAG89-454, partial [uncultured Gemmatimonadetes bacterium]